jgi:uncharacterized membrane protein YecN with MAPEG domain
MLDSVMNIISIYAALLAILFFVLSIRTIYWRRTLKIGVGDGGNKRLQRAMRVHANFAEYVPLCLIMLMLVASQNAQPILIHCLAGLLVIGRCLHAYGLSQEREKFIFRVTGMAMTFTVLLSCAVYLLVYFINAALVR